MGLKQPAPQEPPELWRWEGEANGWTRIDEPPLQWSDWTLWTTIDAGSRKRRALTPPIPEQPGVYEIRRKPTGGTHPDERFYIGSTGNLSERLHDGLMRHTPKGNTHPKQPEMLKAVNGQKDLLEIRWAPSQDRQKALFDEQFLSSRYLLRFGRLPDFLEKIG